MKAGIAAMVTLLLAAALLTACGGTGGDDDDAMVDSDDDTATDDDSAEASDDDAAMGNDTSDADDDTADAETGPYEFAPPPSDDIGVFVATTGDDANPGTMAAPKRTFDAGTAQAEGEGKAVFVAEGEYTWLKKSTFLSSEDMSPPHGPAISMISQRG
ncbi:MAG: hypothetical protein M5R36_17005 [Deltaproteobacteria bacterium]|nr:hypothetical protein [Deltaproteobacteria bacterium]